MLISYRWLAELLHADPGPKQVAERLTAGGFEVERLDHVGANLAPVRVARVLGTRTHPSSKNPLSLVSVDTGAHPPVEVVCGASNVPAPGGLVCFAPLGTTVFDKKGQPFTLEAKPIAGVVSQGMLCAEDEMGLGPDHDGIVVLPSGDPGAPLSSVVRAAEDWVLTLSVTPNRPDALGHIGVAREVAALLDLPFRPPVPKAPSRKRPAEPQWTVDVRIEDRERCPRYGAAVVDQTSVGPSPLWLRARLHRLGVRPISNAVDITNLVMLEYGKPIHAYDFDELPERTMIVRRARRGESLKTLDGVTRQLDEDDVVNAEPSKLLGLAGVMGGEHSGVTARTKTILLESAYFDPRSVRRTARRHGIHSEASHRFERDVDIDSVPTSLARAIELLGEIAGGVAVGDVIDAYPTPRKAQRIELREGRIAHVLGVSIPGAAVRHSLAALGFNVVADDRERLTVEPPTFRPDVTREIDLIEEVARAYGYDKIPSELPPPSVSRAGSKRDYALRRILRDALAALGLDEAVSYPFLSARDLESTGFGTVPRARITNPLSEERSLMRPSLLPGLLLAAARSHRYGAPKVRLFEVGTVFALDQPQEPGLLRETTHAAVIMVGPRDTYLARPADVDFFDIKGVLEELCQTLLRTLPRFDTNDTPPPWAHPRRYARVSIGETALGVIAELHPDIRERVGLPRASVVAEIATAPLASTRQMPVARAPGRFPTVRRDVALLVPRDEPAAAIGESLQRAAGAQCESVELFDLYEGKELPDNSRSLAFALWFRSDERTLTDDEVDTWTKAAVARAAEAHHARQR